VSLCTHFATYLSLHSLTMAASSGTRILIHRMSTFCRQIFLFQSWQACQGWDNFMDTTRCSVLFSSHPWNGPCLFWDVDGDMTRSGLTTKQREWFWLVEPFLSLPPKLNGYTNTVMTLAVAGDCTAFVWFCCTSPPSIYLALVHYCGGSLPTVQGTEKGNAQGPVIRTLGPMMWWCEQRLGLFGFIDIFL